MDSAAGQPIAVCRRVCAVAVAAPIGLPLLAQQPAAPAKAHRAQREYLSNFAGEDWIRLKERSLWRDFFDPVKYIALPSEDWHLSLSREARLSPQGFKVRGDDERPSTGDHYFLQRYLFGVDLRMGQCFRVLGELQSGIINGRIASPRPSDKDTLEVHQAFVEYIAPSQGLDVKHSFNGLLTNVTVGKLSIDGSIARLVKIRPGAFDDPPDPEQEFWGVNFTRPLTRLRGAQANFHYLGLTKKLALFVQGIGREVRHTLGGRVAGRWKTMDYNYDLIWQWVEFRGAPARAWAVSTDTGVLVPLGRLRGRVGATINSTSGDKDRNNPALQSFNPMFPGNSYSGIVGPLGPTNMTGFTPSSKAPVRRNLLIAFDSPFYYRTGVRDGVYSIDLRVLLPGQSNLHRFVGFNAGVIGAWQATRHVNATGAITRFQSRAFLADTFVKNGFGSYSIAVTYRFCASTWEDWSLCNPRICRSR